ncbi:MAG: hypothetical protein SH818_08270 [Saprospiraceae bacterium]|nr:hypothetical protein [Saprospiraceae bacterium]
MVGRQFQAVFIGTCNKVDGSAVQQSQLVSSGKGGIRELTKEPGPAKI